MHELSIALSLIDGVLEEAEKHEAAKVSAVHLKLGALSGVDKEALLFSYSIACDGTPLQGSRLVIENVPVTMHCPSCGADRTPDCLQELYCPECRNIEQDIVHGREIEVTAMEIEE
jgi:hydrogenase nickel incorporation protein HypA/HybF